MNSGVAAYKRQGVVNDRIEQYAYLVKRIAHHLLARLPNTVQLDDLLQAGMIGLIEAQAKYDPGKGASFETYAGIRIRGAMLDEMRRGDWAPRSVHRNARRVTETIQTLEHGSGREVSDREIAQALDVSLDEYHKILHDAASTKLVSYEEVNDGEDNGLLPRFNAGDHGVEYQQMMQALADSIADLPERERLVMALYYDEELNLKEIGAVLEVSESRVSQILSKATLRVKSAVAEWRAD